MAQPSEFNPAAVQETDRPDWLFRVFIVWAVIFLCRPQDPFPFLAHFRPALLAEVLSLGLFVFKFSSLGQAKYLAERQIKCYLALVAVMIVGIPFSLYPRLSFMIIFTVYINQVVFVLIFYKVVNSVLKITRLILLCCLASGLYAAVSIAKGSMAGSRLSFGGMFDPNDLAYYALGFLPLNLIFITKKHPLWVRLACLGSTGVMTLMIFLTGSRGGLLAFAVSAFLILVRSTSTITAKMKVLFMSLSLVLLMTAPINTERYMTLFNIGSDYNFSDETGRIQIWKSGLNWLLVNPFTGVGVGCFAEAIGRDREARGAETLEWQAPHNSAVQIGTETGVIGLLLYLGMSVGIWRTFLRGSRVAREEPLKKICEMGLVGFSGLFLAGLLLSQAYAAIWGFYLVLSAVVNKMLPVVKMAPHGEVKRCNEN